MSDWSPPSEAIAVAPSWSPPKEAISVGGPSAKSGIDLSPLKAEGYSDAAISGIRKRLMVESSGNPAAVGDGGTSLGLAQWHNDRKTQLQDFAKQQGTKPDDPNTQVKFLAYDLKKNFPTLSKQLKGESDEGKAYDAFTSVYERPKGTPTLSRTDRVITGLADPFKAAGQIEAKILPQPALNAINWVRRNITGAKGDISPESVDQGLKQREQDYQLQRESSGQGGTPDWWRVGGNVAATLPLAALNPIAGGAIAGGLQPETGEGNFWAQKAQEAALGGAAGKLGQIGFNALGRVIAPALRPEALALANAGVKLRPSTIAGNLEGSLISRGIGKTVEGASNLADKAPVVGLPGAAAKRAEMESWNTATINKQLEPLGVKAPDAPVDQQLAYAAQQYDNAANAAIPKLKFDSKYVDDLAAIRAPIKTTTLAQQEFEKVLADNDISRRISRPGGFVQVDGELKDLAEQYGEAKEPWKRLVGTSITKVRTALRDNLRRVNPKAADILEGKDTITRIADASEKKPNGAIVFTPSDLTGDPALGPWAKTAQKVIGDSYPTPSLTGRSGQAGAVELAASVLAPHVGVPAAAVNSLAAIPSIANYAGTRAAGSNLLKGYVLPGSGRNALASFVRAPAPYVAPSAAIGAEAAEPSQ